MRADLIVKEQNRIAASFPELTLDTTQMPPTVTGIMRLDSGIGYTIQLIVPDNYPENIPHIKCDPKEIPWEIDRHVYPNGIACLCVSSEYRRHWPHGSDITDFLKNLVKPFLVGQAYFEAHGHWPPGRERSHGAEGILEAYRELLAPLGSPSSTVIRGFMHLLARSNHPKGDEDCPCGSGRKLRRCHRTLLVKLRRIIAPEHAESDFQIFVSSPENHPKF